MREKGRENALLSTLIQLNIQDNSSAILGPYVTALQPMLPTKPSRLVKTKLQMDVLFTAETHNFPSGVAPVPGAETGAGGRIRDTHATGIGSYIGAATAGYGLYFPQKIHP